LADDGQLVSQLDAISANISGLRIRASASESNSTNAWTRTSGWDGMFTVAATNNGAGAVNQGVRAEFDTFTGTSRPSDPKGGALGATDHASIYVVFREVVSLALSPSRHVDVDTVHATVSATMQMFSPSHVTDEEIFSPVTSYQMFDNDSVVDADVFFVPQATPYNFILHSVISFDEIITPALLSTTYAISSSVVADDDVFGSGVVSDTNFETPMFSDEDEFFVSLFEADQALFPETYLWVDLVHAADVLSRKTINPAHYADVNQFRVPVVTKGAVTLTPSLVTDTDTIYSPAANALRPSHIVSDDVFSGASGIARGPVAVIAPLHVDADNLTTGMVSLEPSASQLLIDTDIIIPAFVAQRRNIRAGAGVIAGVMTTHISLTGDRDRML
jgi:hypothetical protein